MGVPAPRLDRLLRYRDHRVRVLWGGRPVAGFARVRQEKRRTEVVAHRSPADREGAGAAGRRRSEAIILESGVTHDREFAEWARASAAAPAYGDARDPRDVVLQLRNEAGQIVLVYRLSGCWASRFDTLAVPGAGARTVTVGMLVLENDGAERDHAIDEPVEPTFPQPAPG